MSNAKIMYCCTSCADNNPEMCGYFARDNLRVMADGSWLCDGCFDEMPLSERGAGPEDGDGKCWNDFPQPPEYGPLPPAYREGEA
jgi:hypothetical protein